MQVSYVAERLLRCPKEPQNAPQNTSNFLVEHDSVLLLHLQYGFFCYAVHSFASQLTHHPELFSDDTGIWARSTRTEMLKLSGECFRQALDLEGTKHAEPWIYWMMLGKIGAKLGKPITEILQCLAKVSMFGIYIVALTWTLECMLC